MLIVLATSPRVAPGLLSWPAWQALRSASVVVAPSGHPQLPALDEADIAYRVTDGESDALLAAEAQLARGGRPLTTPVRPSGTA